MSNESVDRNVLFGVMAWQLGVIERETLLTAMYAWMTDRSRSLPDVLADTGSLSETDRRWVDQAVERRLQKHECNAGRTLAALGSAEEIRRELSDIADGRAAAATLAAPEAIDRRARTIAPRHTLQEADTKSDDDGDFDLAAAKHDRFRVVRPHARGGLGEVFVAVDEELQREVALKQILTRHADSKASRARFLLEAKVTGNLEHPGVVPVYGLGTQSDGRPYYAMRFIRGESLEDAIRRFHEADRDAARDPGQRAVELRNLLTRFVAVCNTIEYAHSRRIVHRDLKPENIMLGAYGETLVVDWGLGRPLDQAHDLHGDSTGDDAPASTATTTERPTMMGSVVGTPQFMSPEQASGRLDLIGPPSDVYSLGATLYCLLTDQPAFTASDVRKVLRDVQSGKFAPPRQVKRSVPRGLEAVCLRAMALRPEDRYPSARAIADDVEHWLADEPVTALQETPLERTQRWMRRHKSWTRAAAAALFLVAGTAWFAYAREAVLRADLQEALTLKEKARQEADHERERAEAHARRAEEQSSLALATLKSVLFDIQAKLKNVPAAHTVRLSMLTTVIDGLKQVARSLETAADTDHSLVRAHIDLGDIFLQVGGVDSAGATLEAQRQFERGVEVAEKLRAGEPRNSAARGDLAAAYQRMGDVSMQRGNLPAAVEWLTKSLSLRQELVGEAGADAARQRDLAASIQRLGIAHEQLGDMNEAQDYYSRFFELAQQIATRDPKNYDDRRNLSVSYERMGDIRLRQRRESEAEEFFRKSLEVRQALADEAADNPVANRDVSVTLDRLGELASRRGDSQAAEAQFMRSLTLRKKLFEDDPNNAQAQRDLLVSYALLGDAALNDQDVAKSADYFKQYHELAQKLAAGDPDNLQLQLDLATSYDRQGYVMLQSGMPTEARSYYTQNYELLKKLVEDEPGNPQIRQPLATACATLGDVCLQLHDLAAARTYLAEYLAETRLRADEHADDRKSRRVLTDALLRNGELHLRLREMSAASRELNEAHRLASASVAASSDDVTARMYLANSLSMLAQYEVQNRDPAAATKHLQAGIVEMRRAGEGSDADMQTQIAAWIKEQESIVAQCATAQAIVRDFQTVDKQDPALAADLLDFAAARTLAEEGPAAAKPILERLAKLQPARAQDRFIAARRYAAAAQLPKQTDAARRNSIDGALSLLQEAADLGAFRDAANVGQLEFADDFAVVRERSEFGELLARAKQESAKARRPE